MKMYFMECFSLWFVKYAAFCNGVWSIFDHVQKTFRNVQFLCSLDIHLN